MQPGMPVPEAALAAFLRITAPTMRALRRSGRATPDESRLRPMAHHASHYYYGPAIDRLLHTCANNAQVKIPTFDEISTGVQQLLTTEEVAKRLDRSQDRIQVYIAKGEMLAFTFGVRSAIRVPSSEVARFARKNNSAMSLKVAARVLCIDPAHVTRFIREGKLTLSPVPGRPMTVRVSMKSVLSYLAQPGVLTHCTPERWAKIRLEGDEELISITALSRSCGSSTVRVPGIVKAACVPTITTPSGWQWLPKGLAMAALFEHLALPLAKLAEICGVSHKVALAFRTRRAFCKNDHPHVERGLCPRPSCIEKYVHANATHPSLDGRAWLSARLNGVPLLGGAAVAEMVVGGSLELIAEAVATGLLVGTRLPRYGSGSTTPIPIWFLETDALVFKRVHERLLRRDYHVPIG